MYNKSWYKSLKQSSLSPPGYVFGIVWPILYTMMGASLYFTVTNKKCVGICRPLPFFFTQLAFNLMWTTVFFKLRMKRTALALIFVILFFTILTFKELLSVSNIAAKLLVPYILWLSFAGYLNLYIVLHNK